MPSPCSSNAIQTTSQTELINSPSVNDKQNVNRLSFSQRIKNCFTLPKTLMGTGIALMGVGGAIAASPFYLPGAQAFTPALWILGGAVVGLGALVGAVGLAVKAYRSYQNTEVGSDFDIDPNIADAFDMPDAEGIQSVSSDFFQKMPILSNDEIKKIVQENFIKPVDLVRFKKARNEKFHRSCQSLAQADLSLDDTEIALLFPQLIGGKESAQECQFKIHHADEASAFMMDSHSCLAYKQAISALFTSKKSIVEVLGEKGALSLWSSLSLFYLISGDLLCKYALDVFYTGETDPNVKSLLSAQKLAKQVRLENQRQEKRLVDLNSDKERQRRMQNQKRDTSLKDLKEFKNCDYAEPINVIGSLNASVQSSAGGTFSLSHVHVDGKNICEASEDIVVNAAKRSLRGGGGVDGAIHAKAGKTLLKEIKGRYPFDPCSMNNIACDYAEACTTHAHGFSSQGVKYIIHVVGPKIAQNENPVDKQYLLQDAYIAALDKAIALGAKSVALPIISSGVYGYPMDLACLHALEICGRSEYQCLQIAFYAWKDNPKGAKAFETMKRTLNIMKQKPL